MTQRSKKIKIHVQSAEQIKTIVQGQEYTMTRCDNLLPADSVAPIELLQQWSTHRMTPTAFCSICLSRSEVSFQKQPGREAAPATAA